MNHGRVTRVVFVLVPKVHLLDVAGPAQVFQRQTMSASPTS